MRDFHREAWFLYTVTSMEWFEQAAQACEDFADVFNRAITGRGLHGGAKLDFWVQTYVDHARDIRKCIDKVRHGDDYLPMQDALNQPAADFKGLNEQPLGWMTSEQENDFWAAFDRLSTFCSLGAQAIKMNKYAGYEWMEYKRAPAEVDKDLMDRDDGHVGDLTETIGMFQKSGELPTPNSYPTYTLDYDRTCKAGDACPWSGIWMPEQGLANHSMVFAISGIPMQPAYEIVDVSERTIVEDITETVLRTEARDTSWYAVVPLTRTRA